MAGPVAKPRWYSLTLGRCMAILLAVECSLFLSEQFRWFRFNHHKGWTVLITIAVVATAFLAISLWFVIAIIVRWRFQFSIRALLVLTVVVALPLGWLTEQMKKARIQKEAVTAIGQMEGTVSYDWQIYRMATAAKDGAAWRDRVGLNWETYDFGNYPGDDPFPNGQLPEPEWLRNLMGTDFFAAVISVSIGFPSNIRVTNDDLAYLESLTTLQVLMIDSEKVTDAGLIHLNGLTQLRELYVSGRRVTDDGLKQLRHLTRLHYLCISETAVTGVGMEYLTGLPELRALHLDNSHVTDLGLKRISELTTLWKLDIGNNPITDTGLVYVGRLPQLRWLECDRTKVTDTGLKNLKGMPQLTTLFIRETHATDAGLRKLQEELPRCQIIAGSISGYSSTGGNRKTSRPNLRAYEVQSWNPQAASFRRWPRISPTGRDTAPRPTCRRLPDVGTNVVAKWGQRRPRRRLSWAGRA